MLKTSWRAVRRQRSHALLTVFGLSLGIAACLLVSLFVRHEVSFERFHPNADRIVRVTQRFQNPSGEMAWALSPVPLAPALQRDVPGVEHATRVSVQPKRLVASDGLRAFEDGFFFAEPAFFDVFRFGVRWGNPARLAEPFQVFVTETTARRYFGTEDPVGRTLALDNAHVFTVAGVLQDPPSTTHLRFGFVASFASLAAMNPPRDPWSTNALTYLLLGDEADLAQVQAQVTRLKPTYLGERAEQVGFDLQPLRRLHLHAPEVEGGPVPTGDLRYVWLFSGIALLVLLLAVFNYVSLATAQALRRAKEVGIRKVAGASKRQLITQFLLEAGWVAVLATALAAAWMALALPAFAALMGRSLTLDASGGFLGASGALLVLMVCALGGVYPAFLLARFQPAASLHGRLGRVSLGRLRRVLVTVQLTASIGLLACTFAVYQQMQYVQAQRPGLDAARVLVIPTNGIPGGSLDNGLAGTYAPFRSALLGHPGVAQVATTNGVTRNTWITFPSGNDLPGSTLATDEHLALYGMDGDAALFSTLALDLVTGRAFDETRPGDRERAVVLNETAARKIGWGDPIGQRMMLQGTEREVVGVVRDFILSSRTRVEPVVLVPAVDAQNEVLVTLTPDADVQSVVQYATRTWNDFVPELPFYYRFLDESLAALHEADYRLGRLFAAFALLAVVIAVLGLIGLSAFLFAQRTKEIGVRKTLGASVRSLVGLLTRDFALLVGLAFMIAAPLAYFLMRQWLDRFAYQADLGPGILLAAGALVLLLTLGTVGLYAFRTARANPVEALRYE